MPFENRIDAAHDTQIGISIRFIRQWKPDPQPERLSTAEHAWLLAVHDTRECSFAEKFRDACAYLSTHPRVAGYRQRVTS